jgi:acyl-CoA synthetase (AMP-forming)/AMP-acid ligase II
MPDRCNVADFLRHHATARPDSAALRFPAASYHTSAPTWDTWTFAELDHQSDAYARGFVANGIAPGDRTLLLLKPSLDFYAVIFGLFKAGAVPVLLDPGMGVRALLDCIQRTAPQAMVAVSLVHAIATFARRPFAQTDLRFTKGRRWFWGGHSLADCHQPSDTPFDIAKRDQDDDAAIIFTSGSTGPAKGVASKQRMFQAQVRNIQTMLGLQPEWSDVQCFAAFALFDICMGVTSVIPKMNLAKPATADPRDILAAMHKYAPEAAFGSPVVWQNLSRHCVENGTRIDGLKLAITVGAPIPAYLHRRFRTILPEGAQIHTPYGATEGLPVSHIATDTILGTGATAGTWDRTSKGHGTCVGMPAPGIDIQIIAITEEPIAQWSSDLCLPLHEVGEVVIKGDQVSPEYKDAPAANTQAKIADGEGFRHRMGDLGYFDEDGRLWFCGRKAHRLETAQGLIPAVAVEGVFNEHPEVFRTALVGVGARGRHIPVLCVEMEPGKPWSSATERALIALAAGTRWEGTVSRFLHHGAFPTDARHNSKIRREDLCIWAARKCGDLTTEVAA